MLNLTKLAREMAQPAKCLPIKTEDLDWDPYLLYIKLIVASCAYKPRNGAGHRDKKITKAL